MARKRIQTGHLVASTNKTRSIIARRLIVEVKYTRTAFNMKTISETVTGHRTSYAQ